MTEMGCIDYYLLKPITDNVSFYILGRWNSKAAYSGESFEQFVLAKLISTDTHLVFMTVKFSVLCALRAAHFQAAYTKRLLEFDQAKGIVFYIQPLLVVD